MFLFLFSILPRRCSLLATFLSVLFCLLSLLTSDSRFDLVWFRLSCDHGWIRSGSVNVRKLTTATTYIREDFNRQALDEGQLLLDNMVNRGITVHTIYENFVKQISHSNNLHTPPSAMHSEPRNPPRPLYRAPRQRFSAVASDRRARTPHHTHTSYLRCSIHDRSTYGRHLPSSHLFNRKAQALLR